MISPWKAQARAGKLSEASATFAARLQPRACCSQQLSSCSMRGTGEGSWSPTHHSHRTDLQGTTLSHLGEVQGNKDCERQQGEEETTKGNGRECLGQESKGSTGKEKSRWFEKGNRIIMKEEMRMDGQQFWPPRAKDDRKSVAAVSSPVLLHTCFCLNFHCKALTHTLEWASTHKGSKKYKQCHF